MEMAYPGPEIIATAIDNYLNDANADNLHGRKFIFKVPFFVDLMISLLLCSLIGLFILRSKSVFHGIVMVLGLIILFYFLL